MAGGSANSELANVPVPVDSRLGRLPLSMSWWTLCSAVFYLYLAPVLAISFGTANAIIGILLSVLCFAIVGRVYTRRSIATGLSAELVSERTFGKSGAALTALVLAATGLYYGVFEGSILAAVIARVFPSVGYVTACVIVACGTIPFLWSGKILKQIERANFVLLPMYLIGIGALFVLAGNHYGWSAKWLALGPPTPPPFGWWNCFVAYMGVWVLLVITADFARFGLPEDERFHAMITFGTPFYLVTFLVNGLIGIFLVGTVAVSQVSETAVVDASLAVLGGATGLAFIAATQLRINLANFYVATLNTSAVLRTFMKMRLPHGVILVAICALAAVLMATEGAFRYMLVSLQFMGIILCSWIGVTLFSESAGARVERPVAVWEKGPMTSWLAATVLGAGISFAPGQLASFAAPASFIGAAILCLILRDWGSEGNGAAVLSPE